MDFRLTFKHEAKVRNEQDPKLKPHRNVRSQNIHFGAHGNSGLPSSSSDGAFRFCFASGRTDTGGRAGEPHWGLPLNLGTSSTIGNGRNSCKFHTRSENGSSLPRAIYELQLTQGQQ